MAMETSILSTKVKAVIMISLTVIFLAGLFLSSRPDGKLHLVFCNVGQGDAIYIKTPKGDDILIDGGPDDKVLSCLSQKMAFFDKRIEFMVLTHPQADHFNGLTQALRRYEVREVLKTKETNQTPQFSAFSSELKTEGAREHLAKTGQKIDFGGGLKGQVLWPPEGIAESDLNNTSVILRLTYGRFCALLTGDATNAIWLRVAQYAGLSSCEVLKVAHHGSKNATDEFLLSRINPKIGVISTASNNRYGHPHKEVLDLLSSKDIKVLRTDTNGQTEIVSNGSQTTIKTSRMESENDKYKKPN